MRFERAHSRRRRQVLIVPLLLIASLSLPVGVSANEVVDPRTGALLLSVTDLQIRLGLLMVDVSRTLQLGDPRSGLLGPAWQMNWENRLYGSFDQAFLLDAGTATVFQSREGTTELVSAAGDRLWLYADGRATLQSLEGVRTDFELHEGSGRPASRHYPNGERLRLTYSEEGSLARIDRAEGGFLEFHVGEDGCVTRIDTSTGSRVEYDYASGRLAEVRRNGGSSERYVYDLDGSLIRIERPGSGWVQISYDREGRVASRRWSDGTSESYEYDAEARSSRFTDPAGGTTELRWSEDRRQETIVDPLGRSTLIEYDEHWRLSAFTHPGGSTESYVYDDLGRTVRIEESGSGTTQIKYLPGSSLISSIVTPEGGRVSYDFDDKGNLLMEQVDGEVVRTYSYDAEGRLSSRWGIDEPELRFAYDARGFLHSITDSLGQITTYEVDAGGNLLALIDPAGNSVRWVYDDQGRMISVTDAAGATSHLTYDPVGRVASVRDPFGATTTYEYDAVGRLAAVSDPLERTIRIRYGPGDRVTEVVHPGGQGSRFEYDLAGRLVGEINPVGGETRYRYDQGDRLVEMTDPAGETWHFGYSTDGKLIEATGPLGEHTRVTYDGFGLLESLVEGTGGSAGLSDVSRPLFTRQSDALGRPVLLASASGLEVRLTYDRAGNLVELEDSLGARTVFEYDAAGRLTGWQDAAGGRVEYSYDLAGRLRESIDSLGRVRRFDYNAAGDLVRAQGPTEASVTLTYDDSGDLVGLRAANGAAYRFAYDAMGNTVAIVDPAGSEIRRGYDPAGRLLWQTDAQGITTRFSYDALGRMVHKQVAGGAEIRFQYDTAGNLLSADDGVFPVFRTFDDRARLTRIEYPAVQKTLSYRYDPLDRLIEYVDYQGRSFGYEYDDQARLVAVRLPEGGQVQFTYDGKDRLESVAYPNGFTQTVVYDLADRPISIAHLDPSGTERIGWRYEYDSDGNLARAVDPRGRETSYRHDRAGRLVAEQGPAGTFTYDYRANGDRQTASVNGRAIDYLYDARDRLIAAGEERMTYDGRGNLIERVRPGGETRYTWDSENRLIAVTLADGSVVRYGYAPTGERIWRQDAHGKTWLIGDGVNLLAELNAEHEVERAYWHAPGVDRPLMMWTPGQRFCLHADLLGSVAALTDGTGTLVASYLTDAFGGLRHVEGATGNPFVFTGRFFEPDAELYYFRARYYDPSLGRFLSPDPLLRSPLDPEGASRYAYVRNSPTRFKDPLGLILSGLSIHDPFGPDVLRDVLPRRPVQPHPELGLSDRRWRGLLEREFRNFLNANETNKRIFEFEPDYAKNKVRRLLLEKIRQAPRGAPPRKVVEYVRMRQRYFLPGPEDFPAYMDASDRQPVMDRIARERLGLGPPPPTETQRMRRARAITRTNLRAEDLGLAPAAPPSALPAAKPPPVRPPRPNPRFKGSPPLAATRGDWEPIRPPTPKADRSWLAKYTKPPTAGQNATLTVLLTTEMILNCRNQGLTAGECIQSLARGVWNNIYMVAGTAAAITAVAIVSPAAGTVVVTLAALYKAATDIVRVYYEYSQVEQAEEELRRILSERKDWTAANVELELAPKLAQLRRKIDGTAGDLSAACSHLKQLVAEATQAANEVSRVTGEVRKTQTIPGQERSASGAENLKRTKDQLEILVAEMDSTLATLRGAHDEAYRLVRRCDSREIAEQAAASIEVCESLGKKIELSAGRAGELAVAYDYAAEKMEVRETDLQADLAAAHRARDGVLKRFEVLLDPALAAGEMQRAATAKDLLTEPHPSLAGEIRALRLAFGDPQTLDPKIERRFRELEEKLASYRSLADSCSPEALQAQYVDRMDYVLEKRLWVQNRIDQCEKELALVAPDRGTVGDLTTQIREMVAASRALVATTRGIQQQIRDCLAGLTEGDREVRDDRPAAIAASEVPGSSGRDDEVPPAIAASEVPSRGERVGDVPPAVAASSVPSGVAAGKDAVELVWANLDLELGMDRYGIYDVLDHLRDSEIIVRDQRGERKIRGTEAVKFLERQDYLTHKAEVGFIATDKLKQFLREAEERADHEAAAGRLGRPAGSGLDLLSGASDSPVEDESSDDDTLLGVSADEFTKIKRITDLCTEEVEPDHARCVDYCNGLEDLSSRPPCRARCREQREQRFDACYERLKK